MSTLTIAHVRPAHASALVGAHMDCYQQDDPTFGFFGGVFDSILRESGDVDQLIVFADGTVHVWSA